MTMPFKNRRPRRKKSTLDRVGGGGSCKCKEIHRFVTNGPTSGTFEADYEINEVTETISWEWNATAEDVQDAFEEHSEIEEGDVEVFGGPWPFVGLYVKFKGDLAGQAIPFPTVDNSGLEDGSAFMDKYNSVGI